MLFTPSRRYENILRKKGYALIAGIDEAGKGAWAGPVVAAAVILPAAGRFPGVRDSKLLSPEAREELYADIVRKAVGWGVGVMSHEVIDTVGIVTATRRAMEKALSQLAPTPEYVLVDGVPFWKPDIPYEFVVKGDRHLTAIAAASIIAKVTRDRLLTQYHKEFEKYGFDQHKGYGTAEHQECLRVHGPSAIHRRTFAPVRKVAL